MKYRAMSRRGEPHFTAAKNMKREDFDTVLFLYHSGCGEHELAVFMGCSQWYARVHWVRVLNANDGQWPEGYIEKELRGTRKKDPPPPDWPIHSYVIDKDRPQSDFDRIKALYRAGYRQRDIARAMHCSERHAYIYWVRVLNQHGGEWPADFFEDRWGAYGCTYTNKTARDRKAREEKENDREKET